MRYLTISDTMSKIILGYAVAVFIVGLYTIILSGMNVRFLKKSRKTAPLKKKGPRVSVLVPARNEEGKLGSLLESLVNQDYENYEVLVVDDNSEDGTWDIISEYERKYNGLIRGFHGLPKTIKGVNGKTFALSQIEPLASGEILLATDADTRHKPNSISYAVTLLLERDLEMLSGYPTERCPTYLGECCVSAMNFVPVFYVPLPIVAKHPHEFFTIANGQFIMMKKDVLHELGGYSVIDKKLTDDVQLSRHFVKNKKKYSFVHVSDVIECDMYDNTKDAFAGITRSVGGIFPASAWSILPIIFVVILLLMLAFSPIVTILEAIISQKLSCALILSIAGYILLNISWYRTSRLQNFHKRVCVSFSVTVVLICAMYLSSYFTRRKGKGFQWKGREIS